MMTQKHDYIRANVLRRKIGILSPEKRLTLARLTATAPARLLQYVITYQFAVFFIWIREVLIQKLDLTGESRMGLC